MTPPAQVDLGLRGKGPNLGPVVCLPTRPDWGRRLPVVPRVSLGVYSSRTPLPDTPVARRRRDGTQTGFRPGSSVLLRHPRRRRGPTGGLSDTCWVRRWGVPLVPRFWWCRPVKTTHPTDPELLLLHVFEYFSALLKCRWTKVFCVEEWCGLLIDGTRGTEVFCAEEWCDPPIDGTRVPEEGV